MRKRTRMAQRTHENKNGKDGISASQSCSDFERSEVNWSA